eukprot:2465054-Amphidinium_carterae.1
MTGIGASGGGACAALRVKTELLEHFQVNQMNARYKKWLGMLAVLNDSRDSFGVTTEPNT